MQHPSKEIKLSSIPQDFLDSQKSELSEIRQVVSVLFRSLSDFLIQLMDDFSVHEKNIKPKIEYFFFNREESDSFVNEVILPSQKQMNMALDEAADVIHDDRKIYSDIEKSIGDTLALKSSIKSIIELVDDIEIYFLNTMIISLKSGSEGNALTKLSDEMGKLSAFISGLSAEFNHIIGNLYSDYDVFIASKKKIEKIDYNHFLQMKKKINNAIDSLLDSIPLVADDIGLLYSDVSSIRSAIGGIISTVQMDDLFRQDIEKIIYYINSFIINFNKMKDDGFDIDEKRLGIVSSYMINSKINTLKETIDYLSFESTENTQKLVDISSKLVNHFRHDNNKSALDFEGSYDLVYETHQHIIGSINELVEGKGDIYIKSNAISDNVDRLQEFFSGIDQIARKFEIVNILTRIEVARSSNLEKLIGGTLSQISKLPEKIKKETNNAFSLYQKTRKNLKSSIDDYYNTHIKQKESILACVETIETLASQMIESKSHYERLQDEVVANSNQFLTFLESKKIEIDKFFEIRDEIAGISEKMKQYFYDVSMSRDSFIEEYSEELTLMHDYINARRNPEDYEMMILISLLSEFIQKREDEELTFF